MGFDGIIRSGVNLANNLTASLQEQVTLQPWTGQDEYGTPTYGKIQVYHAVVDRSLRSKMSLEGQLILIHATVTIIQPILPNGAAGRIEPVDKRDILTLQDGSKWPIIHVAGTIDPTTAYPYLSEITLGE